MVKVDCLAGAPTISLDTSGFSNNQAENKRRSTGRSTLLSACHQIVSNERYADDIGQTCARCAQNDSHSDSERVQQTGPMLL